MNESQQNFLEVFEPIRERLWRFVRAMVFRYDHGDTAAAEDLMSDTVLQVYERFDSIQNRQAMLAFCFTVASRLYKARYTRRKYWGLFNIENAENISSTAATPDIRMDIELLYQALDKLPLKIKEAVILFELSDLSIESIRAIQGGTLSGVKSRITRGRVMLARLLGADASDGKMSESSINEKSNDRSTADHSLRFSDLHANLR